MPIVVYIGIGVIALVNTFTIGCVAFSFSNWLDAKTKKIELENAPKCGNLCCMYRKKDVDK